MTTAASTPPASTVHLLIVHGVGGHDHLSNLLREYQSFRANLQSVEAPITGEDQIPGWRLTQFEEGSTPPVLRLEPRVPPPPGGVRAVCMYEVNYSSFAGVVRHNHQLDLTGLFVGLDLAVCSASQRTRPERDPIFGARTADVAKCLQRTAGVFTAGTVPIIGLPALLFRNYIGTFVALFTRFFEDIATFVLDKNGEQLISAHLDHTLATIDRCMNPGDRLVIAAHSLGSVVVHNYVVRQWTGGTARLPDTVITFGSPIGLLVWVWLFLDFENMEFQRPVSDPYFCWNPVSSGSTPRQAVSWFNVVNSVDPIATAFPAAAVDLSTPIANVVAALGGGAVEHRYFGPDRFTRVGAAHGQYLNDKQGFLQILLRASGLASGQPEDVPTGRPAAEHWIATRSLLLQVQWLLLYPVAVAAIAGYFAVTGAAFDDWRRWAFAVVYLVPPLTIGALAFFQRLLLGGPTKRITASLIREMRPDVVSIPYRLREVIRGAFSAAGDVDPMAPSPSYAARLLLNLVSFAPTLAAMALPLLWMTWLTGQPVSWPSSWGDLLGLRALGGLALFMVYVIACAAFEIVRTWRRLVTLFR